MFARLFIWFTVLNSSRGRDHHRLEAFRWVEVLADNERLNAAITRALRLNNRDLWEVHLHLRVQLTNILTSEHLCHKRRPTPHDVSGNVERGEQQHRLIVLIHVMHPCDVRRPIADDEVGELIITRIFSHEIGVRVTLELRYDLAGSALLCNVTFDLNHPVDGRHVLEVNSYDARTLRPEAPAQHLAPAPRRCAQVDHALAAVDEVKLGVNLKKFECRTRTKTFFFGFPVVYITLVFGPSHAFVFCFVWKKKLFFILKTGICDLLICEMCD